MSTPRYPCQVCSGPRDHPLTVKDGHTACRSCWEAYQDAIPIARERGLSPAGLLGWESGLILVNRLRCQEGRYEEVEDARVRDPHPLLEEQEVPA